MLDRPKEPFYTICIPEFDSLHAEPAELPRPVLATVQCSVGCEANRVDLWRTKEGLESATATWENHHLWCVGGVVAVVCLSTAASGVGVYVAYVGILN